MLFRVINYEGEPLGNNHQLAIAIRIRYFSPETRPQIRVRDQILSPVPGIPKYNSILLMMLIEFVMNESFNQRQDVSIGRKLQEALYHLPPYTVKIAQ